jgi:hypothetical protein
MKFSFNIDKIENDQAILNCGDGQTIRWPLNKLPAGAKANDKIAFTIGEDSLPKNILNEILGEK